MKNALKNVQAVPQKDPGQTWREFGFERGWTMCNCGCKAPDGFGGTTAAAPDWFKNLLAPEDAEHKLSGECAIDDAEEVLVWHNGEKMSVADMQKAA